MIDRGLIDAVDLDSGARVGIDLTNHPSKNIAPMGYEVELI